eukprot:UN19505
MVSICHTISDSGTQASIWRRGNSIFIGDNAKYHKAATGDNRILLHSLNSVLKQDLIDLAVMGGFVKMNADGVKYNKNVWTDASNRS